MPRPRKYADVVVKSFSVEREVYMRLKAILDDQGKSVSEEVNELLRRRLAELEGLQAYSDPTEGKAMIRLDVEGLLFLKKDEISLLTHQSRQSSLGNQRRQRSQRSQIPITTMMKTAQLTISSPSFFRQDKEFPVRKIENSNTPSPPQ
jgi:predicted CopG family antitoxin